MSYKVIGDKIFDAVDTVTKLNGRTYNYDKTNAETFPLGTVTPSDGDEASYDTASNISFYNFKIRLYERNKKRSIMENEMRIMVDDVLYQLRRIPRGCDINKMDINISWGWSDDEQPLRIAEIDCKCQKLDTF